MEFIKNIYTSSVITPLMTDKYHITTAYGYWLEGRCEDKAVFYMFGKEESFEDGYLVSAGIEFVIEVIEHWQKHGFLLEDLEFLRSEKLAEDRSFTEDFIAYLSNMKFALKVDGIEDGTIFFPHEPILRVEGPIIQVKMLESIVLCIMNGHVGYISHGARQSYAIEEALANGSPLGLASVQGLRRGPTIGAALESSRSLVAGGYSSTSTGIAAKQFAQVFSGTMDHAWVMTHSNELGEIPIRKLLEMRKSGKMEDFKQALKCDAFRSFAIAYPENGVLLVDTYDVIQGLEKAIIVIKELQQEGLGKNYGVRFDSGDIVQYSKIALRRFAQEGFIKGLTKSVVDTLTDAQLLKYSKDCNVFCAASDGIDEYKAIEMRKAGAFIKFWGIGTAGSHPKPVGLVYKASLISIENTCLEQNSNLIASSSMKPIMKVSSHSPNKSSNPGKINSKRFYDVNGILSYILLYDELLGFDIEGTAINMRNYKDVKVNIVHSEGVDLLAPIFSVRGEKLYQELPSKETFFGSKKTTADTSIVTNRIKNQLETIPELVKHIQRPKNEILKDRLLEAFNSAIKSQDVCIDITNIAKGILERRHIPIFLDKNLFNQRMIVCQ